MAERLLFVCSNLDHALQFEDLLRRQAKMGEVHVLADRHSSTAATARFVEIARKLRRLSFIPRPAPASARHHVLGGMLRATLDVWRLSDDIADPRVVNALCARFQPGALRTLVRGRLRQRAAVRSHVRRVVRAMERSIPLDRTLLQLITSIDPDIMLVTPVAGLGDSLAEYVRVARRLRIPTLGLAAAWDEFIARGPIHEAPDSIAAWNAGQRRQLAHAHDFPPQSIAVVGAPSLRGSTAHAWLSTDAFASAHGLDPGRPIVLFAAGDTGSARDAIERFDEWLQSVRSHVHTPVSVVVCPGGAHEQAWREWRQPDEGVAILTGRLVDALPHCAVLATSSMHGVLEAAAVGCRVLVYADGRAADEVVLFHDRIAREQGWLECTDDLTQHCSAIAAALDSPLSAAAIVAARNVVAPHGLEIPPALVTNLRVIPVVTAEAPDPPRRRWNVTARLTAAGAAIALSGRVRHPPGGHTRVLVAAPSLADVEAHEEALQALVSAGCEVGVVFTPPSDRLLDPLPDVAIPGVRVVAVAGARSDVWNPVARVARGLAATVRASEITPSSHAMWRDRYLRESVSPGFQRLARRGRLQGVARALLPLFTAVERVLPLSGVARTIMASERPDVVVVLSAPDGMAAVNTAAAQIDLIAAAKRCGISTVACVGGADIPVNPWLLHAQPDVAVVWNNLQKKYVTRQRGSARVAVVGASALDACVDESAHAPFDRAEFFERLGLPKRRPYILVAGSTGLMAPVAEEIRLVQRFIRHMRRGEDRELRRAPVLIRPAPGHAKPWAAADFTGLGHVVVIPTAYDPTGASDYVLLPESIRYAGAVVSSHAFALTLAATMQRPAIGMTPRGRAIEALAGAGIKWVQDPASAYAAVRASIRNTVSGETDDQFVRQRLRPNGALLPASQHLTAVIDDAVRSGGWRERRSLLALTSLPLVLGCSAAVVAIEKAHVGLSNARTWLRRRRRAAKRPVDTVSIEPDIDVPRGGAVSAG